jgi:hypothetical protein
VGTTIENITRAFGIAPCGGCAKRKAALNTLRFGTRTTKEIIQGLMESILDPEKVIEREKADHPTESGSTTD